MADHVAPIRAWIDFWNHDRIELPEKIVCALSRADVELVARPDRPGTEPGIVVFDTVSPTLREFFQDLRQSRPSCILAVAAPGLTLQPRECWSLLDAGAADVFAWDHSLETAVEIRERLMRWNEVDRLLQSSEMADRLVGRSLSWTRVLRALVEVAAFTTDSVLITGESGTGKELLARLIHALDRRPEKRAFVVLDCASIVPNLSGSEFFGHERGAFTGASGERDGTFALADGGTFFLDEIGELPLPLQAELLRVVQEGTYKRVGGNLWRETHFRLVCATNRDLLQEQAEGRFRVDLYFRIATWTCRLPALRERVEDILPLADHFFRQHAPQCKTVVLDSGVRDFLVNRPYPGNIRDLRHLVARICGRHVGAGPITVGDIPPEDRPISNAAPDAGCRPDLEAAIRAALAHGLGLKEISQQAEEIAIRLAVDEAGGKLQKAAAKLGVTDRALQLRRAARRRAAKASDESSGSPAWK